MRSLRRTRVLCALAALAAGLAVLIVVLAASQQRARADMRSLASPGPLAAPHAALDKQCDTCHVPFQGAPSSKCLECHQATAKRIATGKGTHAAFGEQKCSTCHHDHRGRGHELSPPVDAQSFDHKITGFVLEGRHGGAACALCHPGNKWVGMATSCVGCHGDTHHKGALGTACSTCHTPQGWQKVRHAALEHRLPLTGEHARLKCADCHKGGTHLTSTSQCGDCHAEKHGGTKAPCDRCHHVDGWKNATFQHDFCTCFLPGKHQTANCLSCHPKFVFNPTPMTCAGCHDSALLRRDRKHDDLGPCGRCHSALSWKKKVFDHNKMVSSFPIDGRHNEVGCENCHTKPNVFKGASTQCEGCHKTPAGHGDFGACAPCHTTRGFAPSLFSHNDKTRFPLDGPHARVTCQTCHARFAPKSYVPGPNACALCHGDPHQGQFRPTEKVELHAPPPRDPRAHLMPTGDAPAGPTKEAIARATPGACTDCHLASGWKPSTINAANHQRFRFALDGAHARVECARCHPGGARAKFVGTPTKCASCHVDFHGGRMGGECQSCHVTETWKKTPGFDHGKRTGFALAGAHAGRACAECHGETQDRLDKVARPITCATCHTPAHGTQFGSDCAGCHRPTRFSEVPGFDHRKTGFPLERRHAALGCLACHGTNQGVSRPSLSPECSSCHGDLHRGAAGSQCQDCHRPDNWLLIRFDHDRTEWPLRGKHFVGQCVDCHKNNQFTGVRTECVSCHAAKRPSTPVHMGQFDCASHHTPFKW